MPEITVTVGADTTTVEYPPAETMTVAQIVAYRRGMRAGVDYAGPHNPIAAGHLNPDAFYTDVEADGSGYSKNFGPGRHSCLRIWAQIRVTGSSFGLPRFDDCIVAGGDPDKLTQNQPAIKAYSPNTFHAQMWDSTIDPSLWATKRGRRMSGKSMGFQGHDWEFYNTRFTDAQDFIAVQGNSASRAAAVAQYMVVAFCELTRGFYENNVGSIGQPHTDGVQATSGKNFHMYGCFVGGRRDHVGYMTWPGGYNSGFDCFNAAAMIQQDIPTTEATRLENWMFEYNIWGGGTATWNLYFKNGNDLSTVTFRFNFLLDRDWDESHLKDAPAGTRPGVSTTGVYASVHYNVRPKLYGNRYWNGPKKWQLIPEANNMPAPAVPPPYARLTA